MDEDFLKEALNFALLFVSIYYIKPHDVYQNDTRLRSRLPLQHLSASWNMTPVITLHSDREMLIPPESSSHFSD
jgi:hypothetical protein